MNTNYIAKRLLCYITLVLILSACSSQKRARSLNKTIKKSSIDWILTEEETTSYKEAEKYSEFAYYYDEIFNYEYLISYNEMSQTFLIFDYNSTALISKFKLEHQIYSMYAHNADSIFVCYNSIFGGPGTIFGLLDRKGKQTAIYDLTPNMVIDDLEKLDRYGNRLKLKVTLADNPYSLTNFCLFDNSLYLNISPQTSLLNKFVYPIMAIAPLANQADQAYSYMFSYPEIYKQKEYFKADYVDFVVTKEQKNITNIIISHILSDSVEINRLIPRFTANEQMIFDTPEYDTLIRKDLGSKFKGKMYPANNGINAITVLLGFKYPYLKYDKFRNIYYRIAVHSVNTDLIPTKHLYMQANTKAREIVAQYQNWSIIVADSLLNKLDEKMFEAKQHFSSNILVTKNGIGIINYNSHPDSTGIKVTKYKVTID